MPLLSNPETKQPAGISHASSEAQHASDSTLEKATPEKATTCTVAPETDEYNKAIDDTEARKDPRNDQPPCKRHPETLDEMKARLWEGEASYDDYLRKKARNKKPINYLNL